ncbi:DUF2851 family protein [Flavobacterium sp. RHBU_3]|uniref:DUF2851 family protein n=1 Tax=Flavobacterium sp. RHBU_3 TaxID=3391184 RepID=UPI003984FEE5
MREDFLHYIWQHKKFDQGALKTVSGDSVQVLNTGQYLQQSGPDFFNAQIVIGSQRWAGNVEIHLKSSDWYAHRHETDSNYDTVILHVVWEHDTEVLRPNGSEIPVLELWRVVDNDLVNSYKALLSAKTWINCEKEIGVADGFLLGNWKERLFFERLERKALPVMQLAKETSGDWEAVLFCFLAKNFGLNTNGEAFFNLAKSLPFGVVRKEMFELQNLEALLFGRASLLMGDFEEVYPKALQQQHAYIQHKYQLKPYTGIPLEFFRHRPDNFPTIRLAQLAALYHTHQNLFSKIIHCNDLPELRKLFSVQVSEYWHSHYRFDKESTPKRKGLSVSFVDLLIINSIVPVKFAYVQSLAKDNTEELISLLQQLEPESNAVVDKFKYYKVNVSSAYDSQALLQLKNEYCNNHRCMQCAVGISLLKS